MKAVFFDLGGTLLIMRRDRVFHKVLLDEGFDAELERIHSAYLKVESTWLATYAPKQLSPEEANEAYRKLDEGVFLALFPDSGRSEADRVSRTVRNRWPEIEKTLPLELYPDAVPTLTRLKTDGYTMALVSNAPPDTRQAVLSLGLQNFLDPIVISGLVGFSKPHPEIFRIAMRLAGVGPGETVHVGDLYDSDVVGARNAGIKGILLDRDGASNHQDSPHIHSLDEIFQHLG